MALNINGTTGISGVDGTASAPALTGTDSNTGINFASDTVKINTGGSTRATVDSAGNVGLGTTSPTDYDGAGDNLVVQGSGNTGITVATTNTSSNTSLIFSDGTGDADQKFRGAVQYIHNDDVMRFLTASAERMRLGSDGYVGIGVTGEVSASTGGASFNVSSDNRRKLALGTTSASGRGLLLFFNSNGEVGSISTSGTSTAYNTSSDYRLKENVVSISDGITRLKTLKPKRFNFIADAETTVDGFLAHEVTAVPEAITGTKDQVVTQDLVDRGDAKESELGNPVYQKIDQSKLVPLLTAALQEAVAKIEVLETKVAALEAK